ncbi:MAG: Phenylpropionate dioxygenase-like protein large terminal subunit, partial [Mycobacterium sp.]|nr:Phenylpropionate dioxygenase-like protein large terminal subunit [Mycobacterium sp.]
VRPWEMADELRKPIEDICKSGLFGPWDAPDLGAMPVGLNPAKCEPWGLDSFQLFPNFVILFWGQGWYLTYHYWPTSYNTHTFECTLYFPQPRTPRERLGQELAIESRAVEEFLYCDQEILLRHLHKETASWIDAYQRESEQRATSGIR